MSRGRLKFFQFFSLCYCQYCFSYRALHSRHSLRFLFTLFIIPHFQKNTTFFFKKSCTILGFFLFDFCAIFLLTKIRGYGIMVNSPRKERARRVKRTKKRVISHSLNQKTWLDTLGRFERLTALFQWLKGQASHSE